MLDLLAFPDHSRVWIYSSDQEIPDQSIPEIHQEIQAFAKNWLSHGSGLKATGGILHNYFIVLLVDEISNKPGGCSIDTSVKFIQSIGEKYNVNFFNRRIFHYIENEMVKSIAQENLKQSMDSHLINEESLFFDPLVDTKIKFIQHWLNPLKDSWHKKLI